MSVNAVRDFFYYRSVYRSVPRRDSVDTEARASSDEKAGRHCARRPAGITLDSIGVYADRLTFDYALGG